VTAQLLTARQVAERLAVCTETVLVWIRSGRLRAIRLPSGQLRIDERQLVEQLETWATPTRGSVTHHAGRRPPASLDPVTHREDEE
jgi:excisionase family DNA binding protein